MNGQYSWKRTEDIEIDLAELLRRLCCQWKRIAVCALAAAVILGVYGWTKGGNDSDISEPDAEETELTEAEMQSVTDAVRLEYEIRGLETYLDNSVLMQIDPYHKNKYIMLYCIDRAARQELPVIAESYLNFILNGGAADALLESGSGKKMDKSCLAELISAYQKTYSSPYQVVAEDPGDSSLMTEILFYVEITGRDAAAAQKMALDMQDVLKKYSAGLKETAGSHRLRLISREENMTLDSGLQSQQHDKKAALSSNKTSLKAMTDAFSKEQMAVYLEAASLEEEEADESGLDGTADGVSGENISGQNIRTVLKYILLGMFGGIFAYCGVYACWYVFHDTVKSTDEMKRLYTFPVYGGISVSETGRKKRGRRAGMPGTYKDAYGQTQAQALNRIRLACQKQEITKLCAAADFLLDQAEKECLESMAGQLKDWNISLTVNENVSADTAAWDGLAESGNILMVCRIGMTTHRMIDDAMSFYLENGMAVAGAVAFFQNR